MLGQERLHSRRSLGNVSYAMAMRHCGPNTIITSDWRLHRLLRAEETLDEIGHGELTSVVDRCEVAT